MLCSTLTSSIAMAAHIHISSILSLLWFLLLFFLYFSLFEIIRLMSRFFALISHAFFLNVCVCVCEREWEREDGRESFCALLWVLTTLLTPCDDWQLFCPIEGSHSEPLLWVQFIWQWNFGKKCFNVCIFTCHMIAVPIPARSVHTWDRPLTAHWSPNSFLSSL